MGNRAYVIFEKETPTGTEYSPAVYLHWNGGPESIEAFLAEMRRRGYDEEGCVSYQAACFVRVAGEFFEQDEQGARCVSNTVGVENGPTFGDGYVWCRGVPRTDNGVYFVDLKADRIRRYHFGWMHPESVESEREAARRHPYNIRTGEPPAETIAEVFLRIRPKVDR